MKHHSRLLALVLPFLLVLGACGAEPQKAPARTAPRAGTAVAKPADGPTPAPAAKSQRRVRLVTTTSVRDTGLLDALLPAFEKEAAIGVDVIAVGTGAAFQHGRDGNADLLLVHDRKGEEEFVAKGDGAERRDLMWNTFEIAGPPEDPARVKGAKTGAEAFAKIASSRAGFISRGDDSGTNRKELALWKKAAVEPSWPGYVKAGQGMGPTLLIADEKKAYVLTDRGTRLAFRKKLALVPLVADGADLRNDYSVVTLSATKHPDLAHTEAGQLAAWLTSPATVKRIADFQVEGEALFHPTGAQR